MTDTLIDYKKRVCDARAQYLTEVYRFRTGYSADRKFVDFCTDDLGKMQKIVLNTRTKRIESKPLERRI
ncbi:Uncharacterised protein [uncultured archaeon]|nr:Uncharacterised protein [uncultured archaeon]